MAGSYEDRAVTVLLAEDEEPVRTTLAQLLGAYGYGVEVARDGQEALSIADHFGDGIDVLVADIEMPGLRGTELACQLRQTRPDLPVVLISGMSDAPVIAGHASVVFLRKPFSGRALTAAIRGLLGRS